MSDLGREFLLKKIAALEKERDEWERESERQASRAAAAEQERDEWREMAEQEEGRANRLADAKTAIASERDAALAHVARLDADYLLAQKEISSTSADLSAALADNAAAIEFVRRITASFAPSAWALYGVEEWLSRAHPGAALLEEHRKALETEKVRLGNVLARLSEEVEHFSGKPCAAALSSILSGIERVAVRARNEGRAQSIREAMVVCKEEGHPELTPCIADLLEEPESD